MQGIKDWLLIIKYWLIRPIDNFKTDRSICCPRCYKIWHQFRKYKVGQNTLCKDCRKEK